MMGVVVMNQPVRPIVKNVISLVERQEFRSRAQGKPIRLISSETNDDKEKIKGVSKRDTVKLMSRSYDMAFVYAKSIC
jgi:hypothetical protein